MSMGGCLLVFHGNTFEWILIKFGKQIITYINTYYTFNTGSTNSV